MFDVGVVYTGCHADATEEPARRQRTVCHQLPLSAHQAVHEGEDAPAGTTVQLVACYAKMRQLV